MLKIKHMSCPLCPHTSGSWVCSLNTDLASTSETHREYQLLRDFFSQHPGSRMIRHFQAITTKSPTARADDANESCSRANQATPQLYTGLSKSFPFLQGVSETKQSSGLWQGIKDKIKISLSFRSCCCYFWERKASSWEQLGKGGGRKKNYQKRYLVITLPEN